MSTQIYVASSWKNDGPLLDDVHAALRAVGLETLDFRSNGRWWEPKIRISVRQRLSDIASRMSLSDEDAIESWKYLIWKTSLIHIGPVTEDAVIEYLRALAFGHLTESPVISRDAHRVAVQLHKEIVDRDAAEGALDPLWGRCRTGEGRRAYTNDRSLMYRAAGAFVVLPAGESVALEVGNFTGRNLPVVVWGRPRKFLDIMWQLVEDAGGVLMLDVPLADAAARMALAVQGPISPDIQKSYCNDFVCCCGKCPGFGR